MWSSPFIKDLCEPHHIVLVVLVFLVALIAAGAGKGLGGMIASAISKWKGGGNTINIGGAVAGDRKTVPKECEGCGLAVDPTKCVMHHAEHERSMRNEAQIKALWEEYGKLRNESLAAASKLKDGMVAGFDKVNTAINTSNTQILGALAGTRNGFEKPGRGGG